MYFDANIHVKRVDRTLYGLRIIFILLKVLRVAILIKYHVSIGEISPLSRNYFLN